MHVTLLIAEFSHYFVFWEKHTKQTVHSCYSYSIISFRYQPPTSYPCSFTRVNRIYSCSCEKKSGVWPGYKATHALIYQIKLSHLTAGIIVIWLDSHGPDLIEENPIAPHITGSGVFLQCEDFRRHPSDSDFTGISRFFILQIS